MDSSANLPYPEAPLFAGCPNVLPIKCRSSIAIMTLVI